MLLAQQAPGPPISVGLPPLAPSKLHPTVLTHIMQKPTELKRLWLDENLAAKSCVTWFVNMLQSSMEGADFSMIGTQLLEPYLELFSELPCHSTFCAQACTLEQQC